MLDSVTQKYNSNRHHIPYPIFEFRVFYVIFLPLPNLRDLFSQNPVRIAKIMFGQRLLPYASKELKNREIWLRSDVKTGHEIKETQKLLVENSEKNVLISLFFNQG